MSRVVVVIPTFNGGFRVRKQMQTLKRYDPCAMNVPILVVEDFSAEVAHANIYAPIAEEFGLHLYRLPEWRNMHGAAMEAFRIAQEMFAPEWIVYLGDDVFFTPYALTNLLHFITRNDLKHIGLVQPPYWNLHDLQQNVFDP